METLQPKLRFPEFKGDWETKKLSNVSMIGRGKSKHRPRDAEFLYGGKYPFIQTGDIRNADLYLTNYTQTYSEEGLKQSKLWDENTLCITIAANIAETTILKIKACFPDSIIGLIPNEDDTTVLFVKYQFDKFKIEIQNLSQGVAQANLNQEKLSKIEFKFPLLDEQTKIANFLTSVDEKLNLLKEKKELLEIYKKGIMQKIFNQEIRFKDDNGNDFEDWEEILISELTNVIVGGTPSTTIKEYWNGNIAWLSSGELNNGLVTKAKKHITEIGLKNSSAKIMKPNTVMLAMTGATLGKIGFLTFESTGNQSIAGFEPNNNYVSKFFYYNILFNKNLILSMAGGAAQQGINKASIESLFFSFPNIQEQTKIANFLSAIDEKIELVSNQIQDTQEYKKGLLQQMFV